MKTRISLGPGLLVLPLILGCGSTTSNGTDGAATHDLRGSSPDQALSPNLNGCTATSYQDDSAAGATRTVNFGGQGGSPMLGYSPPCMTIAAGQSVTFSGDFSVHPIEAGSGFSDTSSGSPNSPIPTSPPGTSAMVTFPTAGIYPYFCQNHYALGMWGVIQVK